MAEKYRDGRIETQTIKETATFLVQLSRTLSQRLPFRSMLKTIVRQIVFFTQADEVFVVFLPPRRLPKVISSSDQKLSSLQKKVIKVVQQSHQPVAITDTFHPEQSIKITTDSRERRQNSLLALPLLIKEEVVGILLISRNKVAPFEYTQFIFYNSIASRLADYIENAVLMQEIIRKEKELSSIIEHSGEGIAVLDQNGKVIIWNRALELLTGLGSQHVIGQNCSFLHRYLLGSTCPLEAKTGHVEVSLRHAQTRARRFVSVVVSATGGQKHRTFLFRDVSKAKELEEAKNDFVSLATHQLRTPVTAILGYLSMLSEVGPLTFSQKRYLERIKEASRRLSTLIEDLLHVIRLEEERLSISVTPVNVGRLVEEISPDFLTLARQKGLGFSVKSSTELGVFADPKWIRHVVVNLIDNAIKYTREGGNISVSWGHGLVEGRAMGIIHVHDTGIGIKAEEQQLLFQKFGRLGSNPIDVSGTGLGLYIAKQLVEKQGGTIWVKSTHGKGSTFSLAFPLAYKKPTSPFRVKKARVK